MVMDLWRRSWSQVSSAGKALYSTIVGGYDENDPSQSSNDFSPYGYANGGFITGKGVELSLGISVFGVDLGNQSSLVAVSRGGGFECVLDELTGGRSCPTMVAFASRERHVGDKAQSQAIRNWKNTALDLKRLVGLPYDCLQADHERRFLPFATCPTNEGYFAIQLQVHGQTRLFAPIQLLAMVLAKLHMIVQDEARQISSLNPTVPTTPLHAVLAIPPWLTVEQRRLMLSVAEAVEVRCLRLIHETTAAALEWGVFRGAQLIAEASSLVVAFVDCGEAATTISLVHYRPQQLQVVGHVWDTCLGGRDFDMLLVERLVADIKRKYKFDTSADARTSLKLRQGCENLKKVLSANPVTNFECDLGELDVRLPGLTREWFDELTQPLLERLERLINQAQALPLPGGCALHHVEVVGGGSRIPSVKAAVARGFGVPVRTQLNAEEAVARGSGVMAAQLSPSMRGQVREWKIVDRLPLGVTGDCVAIGSAAAGATEQATCLAQPLFLPNAELPASRRLTLPTLPIRLRLHHTPAALPPWMTPHVPAAPFAAWDITPADAGDASLGVEVEVALDASGLPSLCPAPRGALGSCVIHPVRLSIDYEEEVTRARAVEAEMRAHDAARRAAAEGKDALERYIIDMLRAVPGELGEYLRPDERALFLEALQGTESWLEEDGQQATHLVYEARLRMLQHQGDQAVERRAAHTALRESMEARTAWLYRVENELTRSATAEGRAALQPVLEAARQAAVQAEVELRRAPKWDPPLQTPPAVDESPARVAAALQQHGLRVPTPPPSPGVRSSEVGRRPPSAAPFPPPPD